MTLGRLASWCAAVLSIAHIGVTSANVQPAALKSAPGVTAAHKDMVHVPGGAFTMGMADPRGHIHGGTEAMEDARPAHRVSVRSFWIDKTDVTNAQFSRFVQATGYITVAERAPNPRDFPGASPANLRPGGIVFRALW